MTLRYEENPIITIWEQESKSKWVGWVEYDKVVHDLDDRATWHVSRDNNLYTDRGHTSMWTRRSRGETLDGTQPTMKDVVIQEDQDGDLGLLRRSLYT